MKSIRLGYINLIVVRRWKLLFS